MEWVSEFFRKVTIEIDAVTGFSMPLDNGNNVDWASVGRTVDWEMVVDASSNAVLPGAAARPRWTDAQCHAAMLTQRKTGTNIDTEWRYHLLIAPRSTRDVYGVMYDWTQAVNNVDTNNAPREGAMVAAQVDFSNNQSWGTVAGLAIGNAPLAFLRTSVHEIGHAFGLEHNNNDTGFMAQTVNIFGSSTIANPFTSRIRFNYHPDDERRLRHFPDPFVRPGGLNFGVGYASVPANPNDDDEDEPSEFRLTISPVQKVFPLGAPVRLDVDLENTTGQDLEGPRGVSLGSGFASGRVIDPADNIRTFSPLAIYDYIQPSERIGAYAHKTGSLALLRGHQGVLFPMPGLYNIAVVISWQTEEGQQSVEGLAKVMITAPSTESHAKAAFKIFTNPETLLALWGVENEIGSKVVQRALKDDTLRPHYDYIDRRLRGSLQLVAQSAVLTASEREKVDKAKEPKQPVFDVSVSSTTSSGSSKPKDPDAPNI